MRSSTVLTALTCAVGVYAAGGVNYDFVSPLLGNLESNKIIPDVFPSTFEPKIFLNVTYSHMVNRGNVFTSAETAKEPTVVYEADSSKFYTLAFIDAGDFTIPNRSKDLTRNWLVVNIPGSDIAKGSSTDTPYMGAKDPDCGMARYVYALAEQPKEIPGLAVSGSRDKFNLMNYLSDNKMTLVGANFFVAVSDNGELCPGAIIPSDTEDSADEPSEKLSERSSERSSEKSSEKSSGKSSAELGSINPLGSAESSAHSTSTSSSSSGAKTTQSNGVSDSSPAGLALPLAVAFAVAAVGASNYF